MPDKMMNLHRRSASMHQCGRVSKLNVREMQFAASQNIQFETDNVITLCEEFAHPAQAVINSNEFSSTIYNFIRIQSNYLRPNCDRCACAIARV